MEEPLVMDSSRRRKEISWGARPGVVDEERIWETWSGRPVSVERTRRCVSDLWLVKRRYSGGGADMLRVWCVKVSVVAEDKKVMVSQLFCHLPPDWDTALQISTRYESGSLPVACLHACMRSSILNQNLVQIFC